MKPQIKYFAILLVFCVFFCGCTATTQPLNKYGPGDVISSGENLGWVIYTYDNKNDQYLVKACDIDTDLLSVQFYTNNSIGKEGLPKIWVEREFIENPEWQRLCNVDLDSIKTINVDEIPTQSAHTATYKIGDIVSDNDRSDSSSATVILDYNPSDNTYKVDTIFTNWHTGKWGHFAKGSTASWYSTSVIDELYPYVIDYIDPSTISDGDPSSSGSSHSSSSSSSASSSDTKYNIGDIVNDDDSSYSSAATVILDYNSFDDEYKVDSIFINWDTHEWGHFVKGSTARWYSTSVIEELYPYVIGHINPSTISYGDPSSFSSSHSSSSSTSTVTIEVDYSGSWSGCYGDLGSTLSVDGSGYRTFTINNPDFCVSAVFQKSDDSAKTLNVKIKQGGTVLKQGSTSASYGVVSVSATL